MKLTTTIARNLELPSGKTDHIEWDEDFPGFGIRLRVGRNKVSRMWVYQYDIGGRTRRHSIGNVNAIGIDDARKIAGQLQSKVRLGEDPVREKAEKLERAAHTFANVLESFLEVQKRTTRASTWRTTNSLLGREYCKLLHPMPLLAITRRDIANVLTPIVARGTKTAANNVRGKLRTFFNWAIKQGLTESNPVLGTETQEMQARTRVLSMAELVALWCVLDDMTDYPTIVHLLRVVGRRRNEVPNPYWRAFHINSLIDHRDVVRLLMLTACRRNEIAELPWPEIRPEETFIDDGLPVAGPAIVLSPKRVKNNRRFIVPLSRPAQTILLSRPRSHGLVFSFGPQAEDVVWRERRDFSRYKQMLDAILAERGYQFEPWRLHDLRRSVATHMGYMGIQPHVIEEALNHYRANTYNKSKLEGPKRQAFEAWGEYLMAHIEGRTPADNVVPGPGLILGRS
jgi:integrase